MFWRIISLPEVQKQQLTEEHRSALVSQHVAIFSPDYKWTGPLNCAGLLAGGRSLCPQSACSCNICVKWEAWWLTRCPVPQMNYVKLPLHRLALIHHLLCWATRPWRRVRNVSATVYVHESKLCWGVAVARYSSAARLWVFLLNNSSSSEVMWLHITLYVPLKSP